MLFKHSALHTHRVQVHLECAVCCVVPLFLYVCCESSVFSVECNLECIRTSSGGVDRETGNIVDCCSMCMVAT